MDNYILMITGRIQGVTDALGRRCSKRQLGKYGGNSRD